MYWRRLLVLAVVVTTAVACQPANQRARMPKRDVQVSVVNEAGDQVTSARMVAIGEPKAIEIRGTRLLKIDQPVAGTIEADGYLSEPFVIDPSDVAISIKLFSRIGPSGAERLALQFGGDVMMGRRFQQPETRRDTPVVTSDDGARSVVQHVAPIMAAADASTANVETVIGDLPLSGAYASKRYLLESPPEILGALQEMGIDLATLGNNHAYDWLEPGISSTTAALDGAGIPWTGVGLTQEEAETGRIIKVRGTNVGFLSLSTISGDLFNDRLPSEDAAIPADVDPVDRWQYDTRDFGYAKTGDPLYMSHKSSRPATVWREFRTIEATLGSDAVAPLWSALVEVYPELLDSVARRGHGGPGLFDSDKAARSISDLRARGANLVILQLHGGLQFSETNGEFVMKAARAAIDAGADLVIGHHPHVLHGFEWYNHRLIAYSLGNLVFDQDFLASFPSVILRTVFEGARMIDARIVPLVVDRYRPTPVGGKAADIVGRLLDSRSAIGGFTVRVSNDRDLGIAVDGTRATNASIANDGSTLSIVRNRASTLVEHHLDPTGTVDLGLCTLVRAGSVRGRVGVDVLEWGGIDDVTADNESTGAAFWSLNGNISIDHDDGDQFLHMVPTTRRSTAARVIARSSVPLHRWYDAELRPIDSEPTYEVRMRVRGEGVRDASLRFSLYNVFNTDPAIEPVTVRLQDVFVPLPVPDSQDWREVHVDVTEAIDTDANGVRANALLMYLGLPRKSPSLDVDDVQLIEWRDTAGLPPTQWLPADLLRGTPGTAMTVEQSTCSAPPTD